MDKHERHYRLAITMKTIFIFLLSALTCFAKIYPSTDWIGTNILNLNSGVITSGIPNLIIGSDSTTTFSIISADHTNNGGANLIIRGGDNYYGGLPNSGDSLQIRAGSGAGGTDTAGTLTLGGQTNQDGTFGTTTILGSVVSSNLLQQVTNIVATSGAVTNGGAFQFNALTDSNSNTISDLSYVKMVMPDILVTGLSNKFYWGTNTAVVSTNGNDATAILGNPAFPFLTITNAYNAIPTNGYNTCIYLLPNQTYSFGTNSPIISYKNFTVVANGATISDGTNGGQAVMFLCRTNMSWWGGTLSKVINMNNVDNTHLDFHYVNWFPDWLSNNAQDVINSVAFLKTNVELHLDHCVLRNGGDLINGPGAYYTNAGNIFTFNDDYFIGDGHTYGVTRIVLHGGAASFKNCTFAIYGGNGLRTPIGSVFITNSCIIAAGTKVVIDNCNFAGGSWGGALAGNLNGSSDLAGAANASFTLLNMAYQPSFYNPDGTASMINISPYNTITTTASIGYPSTFLLGSPVEDVVSLTGARANDRVLIGVWTNFNNLVDFKGIVRSNDYVNVIFNPFATVSTGATNTVKVTVLQQ